MDKLPTKKSLFKDIARLNIEHLQELMDLDEGNAEVIEEMIQIFGNIYREKMPKIKSSALRRDFAALSREMHSFKVSCHNVGALRAAFIAKEIHRISCLSSSSGDGLYQLITQLEAEIEVALLEIRDFVNCCSSKAA